MIDVLVVGIAAGFYLGYILKAWLVHRYGPGNLFSDEEED